MDDEDYSQLLQQYYEKRNQQKEKRMERNINEIHIIDNHNNNDNINEEERTEYTIQEVYHYYPFLETDYQFISNISDFLQQKEEYKKYYFYLIHKQNGIYYKGIYDDIKIEEDNFVSIQIKNKMGKKLELNIQDYFLFYKIYQATGTKSNLRMSLEPFLQCVSIIVKKKKENINEEILHENLEIDKYMEVLEEEDTNDLFEKINPYDD